MTEPYGHSVPVQRKSIQVVSVLRSTVQIVVATVLVAVLLKVFVLDAIHIPSPSMQSTLLAGDYVFVNKLVYGARISDLPFIKEGTFQFHVPKIRDVRRGDVVVFRLPDVGEGESASQPRYFVKRCIAIAGDEIMMNNGKVFVNGVLMPLPEKATASVYQKDNFGPIAVPRKGDVVHLTPANYLHWAQVLEREGVEVACSQSGDVTIDGTSSSSYTIQKNYLFVLGDNRDHSYDSRYWGFLPEENLIGEAMMIYWSADPTFGIRWNRIGTFVQ